MCAWRTSCMAILAVGVVAINPGWGNRTSTAAGGIWLEAGKMTGLLLHGCLAADSADSVEGVLIILRDCVKRKALLVLDRTFKRDTVDLAEGVSLVRYRGENDTRALSLSENISKMSKDDESWVSQIVNRFIQLTKTHILKIHLGSLEESSPQGRGRHHRKQSMFTQLMMFGMVAAGLIVIPLGFQFLAILGGKALLLAKMALLLSAIQGLKKIATSNLNYGLYSTSHGQGPWHYDRQWPYDIEGHGDTSYTYTGYHQNDLLHPRID